MIELIKLTNNNNKAVYLNPKYVILVNSDEDAFGGRQETSILLPDGKKIFVLEKTEEVISLLTGK